MASEFVSQESLHRFLGDKGPWITVYDYVNGPGPGENTMVYCALIPKQHIGGAMRSYLWDAEPGYGRPGIIESGSEWYYSRNGLQHGKECFVHVRHFPGKRANQNYVEVCEEFRLFHDLFHDQATGDFYWIDPTSGKEDKALAIQGCSVSVKRKFLREFLSAKDMAMVVFFQMDRISKDSLIDMGLEPRNEVVRSDDSIYTVALQDEGYYGGKSRCWVRAKKLITGYDNFDWNKPREFADFIIAEDQDGNAVNHTSDPDLVEQSGKDYTPVFFQRQVLDKYYEQDSEFQVADGSLHCKGFWSLRLDNNHNRYVVVFLKDLWELPYQEQMHWKQYNICPDGHMSHTHILRMFAGEWAEPEQPDHLFKTTYIRVQEAWSMGAGWPLHRTLSKGDRHNLNSIRIPSTGEQRQIDQLVQSLVKVLIDALNEEAIKKHLPRDPDIKNEQGISKLQRFLTVIKAVDFEEHIKFLRNLYSLRSKGIAHLKGKDYESHAANVFGIGTLAGDEVFRSILKSSTQFLEFMEGSVALVPKTVR